VAELEPELVGDQLELVGDQLELEGEQPQG